MNVYIMKDEDGFYKIGKSDNVAQRATLVKYERGKKVTIYAWKPEQDAHYFENQLHRRFRKFAQEGEREWFNFSKAQIQAIIQKYCFIMAYDVLKEEIEQEYQLEIKIANMDYYESEMDKKELVEKLVKLTDKIEKQELELRDLKKQLHGKLNS